MRKENEREYKFNDLHKVVPFPPGTGEFSDSLQPPRFLRNKIVIPVVDSPRENESTEIKGKPPSLLSPLNQVLLNNCKMQRIVFMTPIFF